MRQRSKSVNEIAQLDDSDAGDFDGDLELNLSYTDASDEDVDNEEDNHSGGSWSVHEQMLLINSIRSMVPRKDTIPYDARLKKIRWGLIQIGDHQPDEIASEFEKITNVRKFRLLKEILKDAENLIVPKLGLEKPLPAFTLFMRDYKDKIVQICHSTKKIGRFTQIASEMFKNCSEKEQKKYKAMAGEMKLKYDTAIAKYRKKRVPMSKSKLNKSVAKTKDTPSELFVRTNCLDDTTASKILLRKKYQELDKSQKLKWILRWLGLKKGQKANMAQYQKCNSNLTKDEMVIFDAYEGRPKVQSAYKIFMRDFIVNASCDNVAQKGQYKLGVEQWRTLDKREKATYVSHAIKAKKSFTADFSRFIASLPEDRREHEIDLLSSENSKSKKLKGNDSMTDKLEESEPQSDSELDEDDRPETIFECDTTIALNNRQNRKAEEEEEEEKDEVVTTIVLPNSTMVPNHPKKQKVSESPSTPVKKFKKFTSSQTDDSDVASPTVVLPNSPTVSNHPRKRKVSESPSTPVQKFKKFTSSQTDDSDIMSPTKESDDELSSKKKKKRKQKHSDDNETNSKPSNKENNAAILQQCKDLLLLKPSEDILQYYAIQNHNGSLKKAKKAFKSLSEQEQQAITKQHKKANDKYKRKFDGFVATLTPSEFAMISEKCLI